MTIPQKKYFQGKGMVLITGASSGIGQSLAEQFAEIGHPLVLASRNEEKLKSIALELENRFGTKSIVIPIDLSKPGSAKNLIRLCPIIDFLVNNAGFAQFGPFLKLDPALEMQMLQLNMLSLLELIREVTPGMIERGFGKILNVASTAGFQAGPYMASYAASKAFVLLLGEALHEEFRDTCITVTTLGPGPTVTGFNAIAGIPETQMVKRISMSSKRVARAGYVGMIRGSNLVIPGFWNRMGIRFGAIAPRWLTLRFLGNIQLKQLSKVNSKSS